MLQPTAVILPNAGDIAGAINKSQSGAMLFTIQSDLEMDGHFGDVRLWWHFYWFNHVDGCGYFNNLII